MQNTRKWNFRIKLITKLIKIINRMHKKINKKIYEWIRYLIHIIKLNCGEFTVRAWIKEKRNRAIKNKI